MTWNYRVVRIEEEEYDRYQLYEVYYDDDGKIEGMTEDSMPVSYPHLTLPPNREV